MAQNNKHDDLEEKSRIDDFIHPYDILTNQDLLCPLTGTCNQPESGQKGDNQPERAQNGDNQPESVQNGDNQLKQQSSEYSRLCLNFRQNPILIDAFIELYELGKTVITSHKQVKQARREFDSIKGDLEDPMLDQITLISNDNDNLDLSKLSIKALNTFIRGQYLIHGINLDELSNVDNVKEYESGPGHPKLNAIELTKWVQDSKRVHGILNIKAASVKNKIVEQKTLIKQELNDFPSLSTDSLIKGFYIGLPLSFGLYKSKVFRPYGKLTARGVSYPPLIVIFGTTAVVGSVFGIASHLFSNSCKKKYKEMFDQYDEMLHSSEKTINLNSNFGAFIAKTEGDLLKHDNKEKQIRQGDPTLSTAALGNISTNAITIIKHVASPLKSLRFWAGKTEKQSPP